MQSNGSFLIFFICFKFHYYPNLVINNLTINVETFNYSGEHDVITDAFRDFARRYGIRIFSPRGFRFKLERKSK